jgi:hypothetical protein
MVMVVILLQVIDVDDDSIRIHRPVENKIIDIIIIIQVVVVVVIHFKNCIAIDHEVIPVDLPVSQTMWQIWDMAVVIMIVLQMPSFSLLRHFHRQIILIATIIIIIPVVGKLPTRPPLPTRRWQRQRQRLLPEHLPKRQQVPRLEPPLVLLP